MAPDGIPTRPPLPPFPLELLSLSLPDGEWEGSDPVGPLSGAGEGEGTCASDRFPESGDGAEDGSGDGDEEGAGECSGECSDEWSGEWLESGPDSPGPGPGPGVLC